MLCPTKAIAIASRDAWLSLVRTVARSFGFFTTALATVAKRFARAESLAVETKRSRKIFFSCPKDTSHLLPT